MARKQHLINVHTSTSTTAPTGASLYLGEIAVQHTPNEPALWIKVGSAQTSTDYEKFIGETEIMTLIEDSKILGSGYTYSGLSYVNSATTIADAYSALTNEMILNEKVGAAAINELNRRVNELSGNTSNIEELINENEEIVAGALNILSNRIGTIETQMTGDYIPLTGYELASGTSEEELALSEEDTVNEAFGKLQKQMLDNEEAVAAGFNYFRDRLDDVEEEISHNTGVTALSGAVQSLSSATRSLSAVTGSLSGAVVSELYDLYQNYLPNNYTRTGTTYELSGAVMSISAKTSGVLTLNLNGVEQGKYSPSADTTINLEAIQDVTGADVLLTGYELASGSTEEELVVVATDTVNEAIGKLQKQNYDNEAVVAGALNNIDERLYVLSGDVASAITIINDLSGFTGDVAALSASVVDNKDNVTALSASVVDNKNDVSALSASVVTNEGNITAISASVVDNKSSVTALSASVVDNKDNIVALSASVVDNKDAISAVTIDLDVLSGAVVSKDIVIAQSLNDLNDKTGAISGDVIDLSAVTITGVSLNGTPLAVSNHVATIPVTVSGSGIASASNSGSVADAKAVKEYVEDVLSSSVDYKGATGSTPASAVKGDLYIASSAFTVGGKNVEIGDFIIYNGSSWDVIEKNLDGAITGSLTQNTVTIGNSVNSVKSLANGNAGQVLEMVNGAPAWADLPVLSSATTGTGNVVTSILVNDHEITYAKDFTAAANTALTSLSASVVDNKSNVTALSASVVTNKSNISALSASVVDNKSDISALSASVVTNENNITAISASVVDNKNGITALSASVVDNKEAISALTIDLEVLSGAVVDNEYVVAQALNSLNDRVDAIEGDSGLTALSASVIDNKNNVTSLSASVVSNKNDVVTLSASVVDNKSDISALSASVVDNKEAISAVTIDLDVLSAKVEDDEYVIAQAFNDVNDRIDALEGDSGLTALSASVVDNKNGLTTLSASVIDNKNNVIALSASVVSNKNDVSALSASVVDNKSKVTALSASVVTNENNISSLSASVVDNKETISAVTINLEALSAKVEDDEYVIAQTFNSLNDRVDALEGDSGLTALSASVIDNKNEISALSASVIDNEEAISAFTVSLIEFSGAMQSTEYVIAQTFNSVNDRINALEGDSGLTTLSASVIDNSSNITSLSASVVTNKTEISAITTDIATLSAIVEDNEFVIAQALNSLNDRADAVEDDVDLIKDAITVTQNKDVYVYGIGGYNGTNPESASTLQEVIGDIETLLSQI